MTALRRSNHAKRAGCARLALVLGLCAAVASHGAERLDLGAVGALYDRAILQDGGIDGLDARLVAAAESARDGESAAASRLEAWLTVAHLRWRHGRPEAALTATDQALAIAETVDGLLLKARLLDSAGAPAEAAPWYRKASAATADEAERRFIRLRLTMAEASRRNVGALLVLAEGRSQEFRNRLAITLALLGHPDRAVAIFDPATVPGEAYRQHARLAHWALEAERPSLAQQAAWSAWRAAPTRVDGLYALALLVESYRAGESLRELLARIDAETRTGDVAPSLVQLRVDVLIELEDYAQAIAYYESEDGAVASRDDRRRLLGLYEAAGRPDDMIAEYERLIAAEPTVVEWYQALSTHYLNAAWPDQALAVWQMLAAENAERGDVLLRAAESMVRMGFVDEAVAMVEQRIAGAGAELGSLLFLFDLRFARGETDAARAVLQRLEDAVAGGTEGVRELADAYERIGAPDAAIRILEALRDREGELGYDERMRLAWLYSVAERKEDALAAWRQIWVSVSSPARRNLAESQLLLLATELNKLGDVVVELEEKVFLGQADRNEVGLLVRVYTEVGDELSATEVIDEYARYSEAANVERLRQLGRVYRMLSDHAAYDRVLRELIAADAANELEHVQNLVLNMLAHDLAEGAEERFGEIQHWLGRLRELDSEGVSGEFEAGIYSMGGFTDEAIDSYRRALAIHPENSDNLLLMADLMKDAGRRDEAVALLQYAAEHAVDDAAFVVAIDGIINMIGARSFADELTPALRRTFGWVRRIILERIAGHDDRFYLYQLLADIANEVGDFEAAFVAMENALPVAGVRRPAVLRELVTMATPDAGFGGFSTGPGDAERQLVHGRRLIGLQQALPPEVYIGVGKVLLAEGAVQDAVRAFDLIEDITGLINIDQTKAELFLEAGHPQQALGWYARALNVSRDNLGLLTRTAMLREVRGQSATANALYLRALGNVLRALSTRRRSQRPGAGQSPLAMFRPEADTSVTRDYRLYFESLAQGFLITWPAAPAEAERLLATLRTMFDAELAATAPPELGPDTPDMDEYPRLERTARFVRRAAVRAGSAPLAEHVDAALGKHFEAPGAASAPAADETLFAREVAAARNADDFEAAVRFATLAGDRDALAALFGERIGAGRYREGLAYARALLDRAAFRRLVAAMAPTLKDDRAAFLELVRTDAQLVLDIEADLGRELISAAELLALVEDPSLASDPMQRLLLRGPPGTWTYLRSRGEVADLLRHLAATVAAHTPGQPSYAFPNMLADLLAMELTAAQRETVARTATEYIERHDLKSEYEPPRLINMLLVGGLRASNRTVVYQLAETLTRRASLAVDVATSFKAIYEGREEEALLAFVDLAQSGVRFFGAALSGATAARAPDPADARFAALRARILDAAGQGAAGHDAQTVRAIYEFEFPRSYGPLPPGSARLRAAVLTQLVEHFPDDDRYRQELAADLLALGRRNDAETVLKALYAGSPDDALLRGALYFHYVGQQKYEAAVALAADGGPDLRQRAVLDALVEQARQDYSASGRLLQAVYGNSLTRPFSPWGSETSRAVDALRTALTTETPTATEETQATQSSFAGLLRSAWRSADAPSEDGRPRMRSVTSYLLELPLAEQTGRGFLDPGWAADLRLDALLAGDDGTPPRTLFEEIAQRPQSAAEFDLYLRALPADRRGEAHRLYALLADAVDAAGSRGQWIETLGARLEDLDDHDFTVWMLLRHRRDAPLRTAEYEAFRQRAQRLRAPSQLQILHFARLHASASAFAEAADCYRLLAAKLTRHHEFAEASRLLADRSVTPVTDLLALVREAAAVLSGTILADTVASIFRVARRADRHPAYDAYFDAFLLAALGELHGPQEALARAAAVSSAAVAAGLPVEGDGAQTAQVARAVELARLHAKAGDAPQALDVLRSVVARHSIGAGAPEPSPESYKISDNLRRLAALYGLRHNRRWDTPQPLLAELVLRRERLFPATAENGWTGAEAWMSQSAAAVGSWLDDADVDRAAALEVALVIAWQLATAGEEQRATAIVADLADATAAQEDPGDLGRLALMALRVGHALPAELAREILAERTLTVQQEVQLIAGVRDASGAANALRLGRIADEPDAKLALLTELEALAEATGDDAYGAELAARRQAAEAARAQLAL